jgi:hypothetical protein
MEIPQEAVNTLSDTAWGAIWLITVACMGTVITALSFYARYLNKIIVEISNSRTNDAKEMFEASNKLTRESLDTVSKACQAIDGLGSKIQNVESAISRFRTGGAG